MLLSRTARRQLFLAVEDSDEEFADGDLGCKYVYDSDLGF